MFDVLFHFLRLTQSQAQHSEQNEGLHQRINELKSSLGSAQLDVSQWVARYDSLMEQHQNLDLTMTKLDNHCEVNTIFVLKLLVRGTVWP